MPLSPEHGPPVGPGRIARFLGTGVLNTAVGFALYAGGVWSGLAPLLSLSLATIIGVMWNFLTYRHLVFDDRGERAALPRFLATYAMTWGLNALLLAQLTGRLDLHPWLAQALCLPPTVWLGWRLMNGWVFRRMATPRRPAS